MRIKIRAKILLTLLFVLVFSLGSTDFLWYQLVRPILMKQLEGVQTQIVRRGSDTINLHLQAKKRGLIIHSQSAAFLTRNEELQRLELLTFFTQDETMESITYIDEKGMEQIKLNRSGSVPDSQLQDKSQSEPFKVSTFQYGNEYVGNVFSEDGKSKLTMAIPVIVPNTTQNIIDLTTGTKRLRAEGEILGVLEATFNLTPLFADIIDLGGQEGDVYITDRSGRVIAHADRGRVPPGTDFSAFLPSVDSFSQYQDERNVAVIGSRANVAATGWSVVIQQPVQVAFEGLNAIARYAFIFFVAGVLITFPIGYFLSRRFTSSIADLVKGTEIIGQGNFDYKPAIKSNDEIADLSASFTHMAQQLKQSMQSLQEERNIIATERNKLSLVIAGIQDGIIAVDMNRKVTLLNRAAEDLIGIKLEDATGHTLDELFTVQNGGEIIDKNTYCPILADAQDGVVYAHEKLRLVNSRKDVFVNILTGRIRDGSSTNLGCILTLHNVSKEMQLEEMKLDFVAMAAHELRTPLTAVRGYLAVFMRENAEKFNEEQKSFLNRIATSTQRLASLVDNLLNVSKIERHGLNISPQPVDWPAHVKDLMPEFENYAKEQKVTLSYVPPDGPIPLLNVDKLKIDEVITNLVTNAINYTKTGGHVAVMIEQNGNEVITSVKDDGHGIPEEAVPHLFTKFFRVDGKLEQGSKGTGLGLYISKAIIDLHKGRIWVETKVGQGSTFKFALPIDAA